jgi:hypothetical protein
MRLLLPLVVAQLIGLGWMIAEMKDLQNEVTRLSAVTTMPTPIAATESDYNQPPPQTITLYTPDDYSLDAIREIVRDELNYALAGLELAANTEALPADQLDEEEALDRFYEATNTIDAYASQGRISAADMSRLQQQIAKLSPKHRTQAMQHLTKAMNSGQLDARY